jgi:hypothetical protein
MFILGTFFQLPPWGLRELSYVEMLAAFFFNTKARRHKVTKFFYKTKMLMNGSHPQPFEHIELIEPFELFFKNGKCLFLELSSSFPLGGLRGLSFQKKQPAQINEQAAFILMNKRLILNHPYRFGVFSFLNFYKINTWFQIIAKIYGFVC